MIIVDFDGTLFNTLPVHFRFKKESIVDAQEQLQCHREFIEKKRSSLELYTAEWRRFLHIVSKSHNIYLISESKIEILALYLQNFSLEPYFSGIFGNQFSKDGVRESTIKKLLQETSWLISDNPSDLRLQLNSLQKINAQTLYSSDLAFFRQKIISLEKTIFENKKVICHVQQEIERPLHNHGAWQGFDCGKDGDRLNEEYSLE